MTQADTSYWIAFAGIKRIAHGEPEQVALEVKRHVDRDASVSVMIFDGYTSARIELDLQASPEDLLRRLPRRAGNAGHPDERTRQNPPGRPKLGVVAREVTLLPRHWQWLAGQRGGASAALRRLVEQAARDNVGSDVARRAQNATYEFIHALAGDEPGYEEALRALFAGDTQTFAQHVADWPEDVREHALALAKSVSRDQ